MELPFTLSMSDSSDFLLNSTASFVSEHDALQSFLNTYTRQIKQMCVNNKSSLYLSYHDLPADLATQLTMYPSAFFAQQNRQLQMETHKIFPHYHQIRNTLNLRIRDLPMIDEIRNLRTTNLGQLVRIHGVITRVSLVNSEIIKPCFLCVKCKVYNRVQKPICIQCQSKGPFLLDTSKSEYRECQRVQIQELPSKIPKGRLPRQKSILVSDDLIDSLKPGDVCYVSGIYKSQAKEIKDGRKDKSRTQSMQDSHDASKTLSYIFYTCIEANCIEKKEDELHEAKDIICLSRNPNIKNLLIDSIAPEIFGHRTVKRCILTSLFSGVRKQVIGHCTRGDINTLIVGDPGTAKSQLLRFVNNLNMKVIMASGQGVSSVGLTACVKRDNFGEYVLEGGALVLADNGVCLIDEFDKINENDRVSIHEAMEQQSISISKAGIVASLHARCSVIAACNPRQSRYRNNLSFLENVNLSDPIVSRFDNLCVVRDNTAEDEILARFVLDSHYKKVHGQNSAEDIQNTATVSETTFQDVLNKHNSLEVICPDLLSQYILKARQIEPVISDIDKNKLAALYADLRNASQSGTIVTARHVESMVRLSEAYARMRLSEHVNEQDLQDAIETTLESFINVQKYSMTKQLRKRFGKYLIRNKELCLYLLGDMINEKMRIDGEPKIYVKEFEARAKNNGLEVDKNFYGEELVRAGFVEIEGYIQRNSF